MILVRNGRIFFPSAPHTVRQKQKRHRISQKQHRNVFEEYPTFFKFLRMLFRDYPEPVFIFCEPNPTTRGRNSLPAASRRFFAPTNYGFCAEKFPCGDRQHLRRRPPTSTTATVNIYDGDRQPIMTSRQNGSDVLCGGHSDGVRTSSRFRLYLSASYLHLSKGRFYAFPSGTVRPSCRLMNAEMRKNFVLRRLICTFVVTETATGRSLRPTAGGKSFSP